MGFYLKLWPIRHEVYIQTTWREWFLYTVQKDVNWGSGCHLGVWENKDKEIQGKDVCRGKDPEGQQGNCQPGKRGGSGHLWQGAQLGMNGVDQAWWEQPMEARGRSEAREVRLLREILSWRWGRAARGMDVYVCIWSHMETGSLKEGDSISTGKGSRAHGSHRVKVRGWGRRIDKRAWGLPVLNAAIAKSAWATDCNTLGGGGTFSQFRMPCVSRESKETQSLLLARLWRELLSLAPADNRYIPFILVEK